MEHRFGEERVGDERACLQPTHGNEGQQRVAQRMHDPYAQRRCALGAGRAYIIMAELVEHGAAHQSNEQRQHDGGQRHCREQEMLKTIAREESGLPKAEVDGFAAAERRQPTEPHREDGDEDDAGQEYGHGNAEHAEPQDQSRAETLRPDSAIDAAGQRQQQHDEARTQHEFEAGRELRQHDLDGWLLVDD